MKREDRGGMARGMALGLVALLVAVLPIATGCQRSEEPSDYIPLLASTKEETQRRAIEELIRMQQKAVPAVTQALRSETPLMRIGALKVLAKIRRMESVTLSGEMIDDTDPGVQHQAIATLNELAQVWKEKSVELLSHALELSDPVTVRTAAVALAAMAYEPATEALRKAFETGQGMKAVYAAQQLYQMEADDAPARLLLAKLSSSDKAERDAAVDAIVGVRNADGTVAYAGLEDKFVGQLVQYIDTQSNTSAAQSVLAQVRDSLITELGKILDSRRAAQILEALGTIADRESVDKLQKDIDDTRLESSWRVAAANALGIAGMSKRAIPIVKIGIIRKLTEVLENTGEDSRVRIGAAIALCRLRQQNGVAFLLDQLAQFEQAISATSMTESRLQDLTALRIRAQEALTQSGQFVVSSLMKEMEDERTTRGMDAKELAAWEQNNKRKAPGNITVWAAAKTMGELNVQEAVPYLGSYVTEQKKPKVTIDAQGRMLAPDPQDPTRLVPTELALKDWQKPDVAEVTADEDRLEVFAYPDYVRLTAAIALGTVGGEQATSFLQKAEQEESAFLGLLAANRKAPEFYKRAPIIDALTRRHEDVLFYIRLAQQGGVGTAQRTGS
jgi:HEAT repeat protein